MAELSAPHRIIQSRLFDGEARTVTRAARLQVNLRTVIMSGRPAVILEVRDSNSEQSLSRPIQSEVLGVSLHFLQTNPRTS
jgi:hypothetical protein